MFFTPAHIIEILLTVAIILVMWFVLLKNIRVKKCLLLTVIMAWVGVFGAYLSTTTSTPKEYVKVIATKEKNDLSASNDICLLGYNVNEEWHNLNHPTEGNWAWYPGSEGASYYYAGWFPSSPELQPKDATDYIVIEIEPGTARSITFLKNPWYGIAQVEMYGSTQEIDTYGSGEVVETVNVILPDTPQEFYADTQMKQLPFATIVSFVLDIILVATVVCFGSGTRAEKISKNRFLFEELVKRDFTLKYKRTVLGMVWSILSPLATLLIMWLVFKDILGSNIDHFAIYMFIGQVVFSFFNDATMQGMTSLLDNAGIFTKVNIPKYMFLLSKNISSLINFGLTLLVLFVFIIIDGVAITPAYLMLIYPIACLILLNIGLGLILSALFVFFRDTQHLWGVFSQLIMWVSAIFYSVDKFDAGLQSAFLINPLYSFITYFRSIILYGTIPSVMMHLIILGYTFVVLLIGCLIYKKKNHEFLYYV